ncbi:hypothetical protein BJX99DRAFT_252803 [Aspergillus californicus]
MSTSTPPQHPVTRVPLTLSIITLPNILISSAPALPYQWTVLIRGGADYSVEPPLSQCLVTQIYSTATGYLLLEPQNERLNKADLDAVAEHWAGYAAVCDVPVAESERILDALREALVQGRRRWAEAFLDNLVGFGWLAREKVRGVARRVGVDPLEVERFYPGR